MTRTGFLWVLPLVVACMAEPKPASVALSDAAIDTGRVQVAGSTLFYESSGAGDPVILLHGGNLDRRMWDAEFEALRRSYRVIRYDARGYGKSGPADTAFKAHEDLRALIEALSIERASLIGLSLGGRIAMDFALAYPERVTRLVLAAPGISGGQWADDADTAWLSVARRAAAIKDSVAVARAWLGSAYIRTALRDSARAEWIEGLVVDQAPFWGGMIRHRDLEVPATPPAAGRLRDLAAPILLVVGSDDTRFIKDVARAIEREAPRVRRVDVAGVGHMVNLEAPQQFLSVVIEFLSR